MNISKTGLVILLAFVLTGCASTANITSDYDDNINFSSYHSFDWMAPPGEIVDPLGAHPTVAIRIKVAIENELGDKGFTKVNEAPDFFVVYHASVEQKLTRNYIDTWGYYYPRYRRYPPVRRYPPAVWGVSYVDSYDEGTLVIDIIDAETNELAWRGAASGVIENRQRAREQIDEAVHLILESFPPYGLEMDEGPNRISAASR